MKKFLAKGRGILLVLFLIICVFSVNNFSSIDLEKTAIIIALGIDCDEEGTYTVTGQLAMPSSSGGTEAPAQEPTMVSGSGPSPAAAYQDISVLTGWTPTLSFCTTIVLGQTVLDNPLVDVMNFALRVKQLNDSALLCTVEGTAKDFFNQKTPLDHITAFSLLKIFSKQNVKSPEISVMSVKDFIQNFSSQSNGNFLPLVTSVPDENSANKTSQESEKSDLANLDVSQIVVFDRDKKLEVLDLNYVRPFVVLTRPIQNGTVNLSSLETELYHAKNLEVKINSKPAKIRLDFQNGTPRCKIDYRATVMILHLESDAKAAKDLIDGRIPEEVKEALAEKVHSDIERLLAKLQEINCDLLQLEEKMYKFHPKEFRKFRETHGENALLPMTEFEINVKIGAKN